VLTVFSAISCGQKGPPLPPIVRTPAAPVLTADRRGSEIQIALTAPAANVDGSRPANITRIDIYAVNGAAAARMTDLQIMKRGTKVASVPVKSPKDPNDTVEKDESADDAGATVGEGLDQGASSAVAETITASVLANDKDAPVADVPLLGPAAGSQLRTYVGVGVDRRGNPGQFSRRISVPLQLPPAPPPPIVIAYEEKKIVITWKPAGGTVETATVLPSRPFGPLQPDVSYNLYDATTGQKLNDKPVREFGYEDTRMTWGTERCYNVRAVDVVARLAVESEATGPACKMLVDTFPPAAPKGLNAVASQGAINLIWDGNPEPDLAGYYVWRAIGSQPLQQITPDPVTDASFFDGVTAGLQFSYAVQAVDKAGNKSPLSERVVETAR
jgi:hypothetical protein